MPSVSVIIPTYNAGPFVVEAVESVLAQTFRDVEVIVVDDGSTDDTRERLAAFGDRITYIYKERGERSAARNLGIQRSGGRYVAFLDADDLWLPSKLEKQVELLGRRPEIGMVYCWVWQVDSAGRRLRVLNGGGMEYPETGQAVFAALAQHDFILAGLSTLVIRRECLEAVGGFEETINTCEEWDLALRIVPQWGLACVPEALAAWRAHGYHMPRKVAPRHRPDKVVEIVERAFSRIPREQRNEALHQQALSRALWLGALHDYAAGNTSEARARLERALNLFPNYFALEGEWRSSLAYFANALYDDVTPLTEALAYLDLVFATLPQNASFLGTYARKVKAELCAIQAFDASGRNDPRAARKSARLAVRLDPRWLKNPGLARLLLETSIGAGLTGVLRQAFRAFSARRFQPASPEV